MRTAVPSSLAFIIHCRFFFHPRIALLIVRRMVVSSIFIAQYLIYLLFSESAYSDSSQNIFNEF